MKRREFITLLGGAKSYLARLRESSGPAARPHWPLTYFKPSLRNVSSPVAIGTDTAIGTDVPCARIGPGGSKSSVFRDPFNSPKLQARSLRIDLRLVPRIGDCGLAGLVERFLMGRKPEILCFRHRSLPQRPAETFRHENMESH
jgi:hypothetical protein